MIIMIKNTFITIQIRYISYKKIYKKLENENKAKNIMQKGKRQSGSTHNGINNIKYGIKKKIVY